MKIGYSVEGSTDRALIEGLRRRWCPAAAAVEGAFRGSTGASRLREIRHICLEFEAKGVDVIVLLTDANNLNWRDVQKDERERCPAGSQNKLVAGVCDRNVECWLAADPDHLARATGRPRGEFAQPDPKGAVEKAFGVTRLAKKEDEIASFVEKAPLRNWLNNASFEDFYEQLRQRGKALGCAVGNLRERDA